MQAKENVINQTTRMAVVAILTVPLFLGTVTAYAQTQEQEDAESAVEDIETAQTFQDTYLI